MPLVGFSGVMMCSKRQACTWASASSMANVSVKKPFGEAMTAYYIARAA